MCSEPRICCPGVISLTQLFSFKLEAVHNEGAERSDHNEHLRLHYSVMVINQHITQKTPISDGFSDTVQPIYYFQLCVTLVLSATGATPGK